MMSFKHFIKEGLDNRPAGTYKAEDLRIGHQGEFLKLQRFSSESDETIKFFSKEDYDKLPAIDKFINTKTPQTSGGDAEGIEVVKFTDANNKNIFFGKYLKKQGSHPSWPNSVPDCYGSTLAGTKKQAVSIKASDFLSRFDNLTPEDILHDVERKYGKESSFAKIIADTIIHGYPSDPEGYSLNGIPTEAVRDYFGEVLHPISILYGSIGKGYSGNAKEGIEAISGSSNLNNYKIKFSQSVVEGLYDSILYNEKGKVIKLSSKAETSKKAAKASVNNLFRLFESYSAEFKKGIKNQYSLEIELLELISRENKFTAPIELAIKLKLINENEKKIINNLETGKEKLTPRLEKIKALLVPAKSSKPVPQIHMISSIARYVCTYINTKTNFSDMATALLNGSIITIYTQLEKGKDKTKIKFKPFKTVWPNKEVVSAEIEARTRYRTEEITGSLGFEIQTIHD